MVLSQDRKSLPKSPTDILGLAISPSVSLGIEMVVSGIYLHILFLFPLVVLCRIQGQKQPRAKEWATLYHITSIHLQITDEYT